MQTNQKLSVLPTQSQRLALSENQPAQTQLDALLLGCFSVQKMYGREPESFTAVTQVFHSVLGRFEGPRVLRAFELWMERSQEFPTPADIINLIKRNGKPPLSKEIYIAISKKDPEHRDHKDWQYLKEYEAFANEEDYGTQFADESKDNATIQENIRLREELKEAKSENNRAWEEVRKLRIAKGIEKPKISDEEKIQKTIEHMRRSGAPQSDIDTFGMSVGAAAV